MRAGLLFLSALVACAGQPLPPPAGPQDAAPRAPFVVGVVQDGRPVPVTDHRASLRRAPFEIVLTTREPGDGILMNVSFEDEVVRAARQGDALVELFQPGTGMAEEAVVKAPELFLGGKMAHHYLIYEPSEPINRYHEVKQRGDAYRCVRRVARLVVDRRKVPVEQTTAKQLHLVFFLGRTVMGRQMERHREYLTLSFR